MIGRVLALGAVLVLLSAVGAKAQDDEDEPEYYFDKEGAGYVELYGAGAYVMTSGSNDGSGGVGTVVGGHFTPHFAMEAQYEFQSDEVTSLASYNFKWVFLTKTRLQPWAKVGAGLMGGRPNHPFLFMGRFDLGMTFFMTDQWGFRGGVGFATAKHSNNMLLGNAGIIYYFQ